MIKKLLLIAVTVVISVVVILTVSLINTPESDSIFWIPYWDILCDSCHGQYYFCCSQMCYDLTARYHETTTETANAWEECTNQCFIDLPAFCLN